MTPFGLSAATREDEEEVGHHVVNGDVDQSPQGNLLRWTKRPSRNPLNSVRTVGLPLDTFQLFIDPQVEAMFPPTVLTPLYVGACLPMNIPLEENDEQRLKLSAIEEYETTSLHWKDLYEDRALPADADTLEQAQRSWAYEEATLRLKASIEVLLRWQRMPETKSDSSGTELTQSSPTPQHEKGARVPLVCFSDASTSEDSSVPRKRGDSARHRKSLESLDQFRVDISQSNDFSSSAHL